MTEQGKPPEDKVSGEHPPNPEELPVLIQIDNLPNPGKLRRKAEVFWDKHPEIKERAEAEGKDVVAISNRQGKMIIIGVGLAAAVAATVGGIVFYRHRHKKLRIGGLPEDEDGGS